MQINDITEIDLDRTTTEKSPYSKGYLNQLAFKLAEATGLSPMFQSEADDFYKVILWWKSEPLVGIFLSEGRWKYTLADTHRFLELHLNRVDVKTAVERAIAEVSQWKNFFSIELKLDE